MQQEMRRSKGYAESPVLLRRVAESVRMIAPVKNSSRLFAGEAIDPGNGVFELLVADLH